MKTRLENQIAIVTGSSSGNGRAIALALSSAGATVVCSDLNKTLGRKAMKKTSKSIRIMLSSVGGAKAVYVQADVRCASEIENLVHQVSDWGSGAAAYFGWMREAKRENTRCGL
jgi:NAD(P)-dependent dehydrogenase (short-subunit alcohol dehydrogenase family)